MITPVRIPETPVILHKPPPMEEESVSVDTSEKKRAGSTVTVPSMESEADTLQDVPVATLVTTA